MPSPIDALYQQVYGNVPNKNGAAYERFAAAVCKLLGPHCEVFQDTRMRGIFSEALHQLDVQRAENGETSVGEAKDYTANGKKIGMGDIEKLGGALGDLPVSKGLFFSATDYTKPALQYAKAAVEIVGKPIEAIHLRPAVESDREGRIETIRIQIHVQRPEVIFGAELTDEGREKLKALGRGNFKHAVDCLFGADGNKMKTMSELFPPECWKAMYAGPTEGFIPLSGAHTRVDGQLIGIRGLSYKVTDQVTTREVVVGPNGKATLFIKSVDGTVDKLITDTDLKKVTFTADNEAVIH